MSKRVTPIQRMVGFGMGATEPELQQAIEMLMMLRNERFPKPQKAKTTTKTRKPRTAKETPLDVAGKTNGADEHPKTLTDYFKEKGSADEHSNPPPLD